MHDQPNNPATPCPAAGPAADATDDARLAFEQLLLFATTCTLSFASFEKELFKHMAALGRCIIRLFLCDRERKLDIEPFLADGKFRHGTSSSRKLKTAYGPVRYFRRYLQRIGSGKGLFPLDRVLGLTSDILSPWTMQLVARLTTRMSFKAARLTCKAVLGWAPATSTIEKVVLGMGRQAAPFMAQLAAPPDDGEVLIIEVDGKCVPTATAEERAKRSGKRQPKCPGDCKCQRHRGRANRKKKGSRKRRLRGDKSKNGKEVTVVVMYTLNGGADGKLHGPINKKVFGTFAGRKAAAAWARKEATKRGFGPETKKTVQIVMDGAPGLKDLLWGHFFNAIFTLDICHVLEKLWAVGRSLHAEGTDQLKAWMGELTEMLYEGRVAELFALLEQLQRGTPVQGPGNKRRHDALYEALSYIKYRQGLMRYKEWREKDLVIASGQVEAAVRQLVGERFDCSGMRWVAGKAEALLHLRCIELNGDWEEYAEWFESEIFARLQSGEALRIQTDRGIVLPNLEEKAEPKKRSKGEAEPENDRGKPQNAA